jgi:hypothetical protein
MGSIKRIAKKAAETASDVVDIVSRGVILLVAAGLLFLFFVWVLSQQNFF